MITIFGLQLSVAVAIPVAEGNNEEPQSTVILIGEVITGSVISVTFTVKLERDTFPDSSVALQVFVVVPIGKVEPEVKPAVCTMAI